MADTLKELMQIAYNQGQSAQKYQDPAPFFDDWWKDGGEERHNAFLQADARKAHAWPAFRRRMLAQPKDSDTLCCLNCGHTHQAHTRPVDSLCPSPDCGAAGSWDVVGENEGGPVTFEDVRRVLEGEGPVAQADGDDGRGTE